MRTHSAEPAQESAAGQRRMNHRAFEREVARRHREVLRRADAIARAHPNLSFRILFYAVPRLNAYPGRRSWLPPQQPLTVDRDRQERVHLALLKLGVQPEQIVWALDEPATKQLAFL